MYTLKQRYPHRFGIEKKEPDIIDTMNSKGQICICTGFVSTENLDVHSTRILQINYVKQTNNPCTASQDSGEVTWQKPCTASQDLGGGNPLKKEQPCQNHNPGFLTKHSLTFNAIIHVK